MARFLVVFLRIHRKSRRKRQAKARDRSGQPVVYTNGLQEFQFTLLQIDRLQLTAVSCNGRGCKDSTTNDPFFDVKIKSDYNMKKTWTTYAW